MSMVSRFEVSPMKRRYEVSPVKRRYDVSPMKHRQGSSPMKQGYEVSPMKRGLDMVSPRKVTGLSPRRVPRSPLSVPCTPPQWKRPDEVMRRMRLIKRQSLTARFNKLDTSPSHHSKAAVAEPKKRKNPFRVPTNVESPSKKVKEETNESNASSNLFHLLGLADPQANYNDPLNFEAIIDQINQQTRPKGQNEPVGRSVLPVDWAIRSKLRFLSAKPFPWSQTLKTCEEASGITGFVRCVGSSDGLESSLDTSHTAMFHQCSLYWQFPWLPWLRLYPRSSNRPTAALSDKQLPSFSSYPTVKDSLIKDFNDSFRSVFQLLRARHCPYFYLLGNKFSCLFRAAGINGSVEPSALISPTTVGFRSLLKENEVEFVMPLRKGSTVKRKSGGEAKEDLEEVEEDLDEEDHQETTEWLSSLGVSGSGVNLSSEVGEDESLVMVEGGEVLALFNVLLNLKSLSVSTGPLAGVPPTILAPVAFSRATLLNLQVRESVVNVENESFHSVEIVGPVMPQSLHSLCDILTESLDEFSVTFATDETTTCFTNAINSKSREQNPDVEESNLEVKPAPAFGIQNLSDSGMKPELIKRFCSSDVMLLDCIKFSDKLFSFS